MAVYGYVLEIAIGTEKASAGKTWTKNLPTAPVCISKRNIDT